MSSATIIALSRCIDPPLLDRAFYRKPPTARTERAKVRAGRPLSGAPGRSNSSLLCAPGVERGRGRVANRLPGVPALLIARAPTTADIIPFM